MKRILVLLIILFNSTLFASLNISSNKSFISSGETLKIQISVDEAQSVDIYVGIIAPNSSIYTVQSNGNIVYGIKPYGTYKNLNKTILNLKLNSISKDYAGRYKFVIVKIPEGSNIYNCKLQPQDIKSIEVFLRASTPRNIEYLNSYFDKIENGNLYYKYAIYEARLISIPDINLYLQADDLFIKTISKKPWTKQWFLTKAPKDIGDIGINDISSYMNTTDNSSFDMSIVNLENYEAVPDYKIYPDNYPFLNWFDRRLQTIGFTLYCQKKYNCKVTYLEKVVINYFIRKYVKKSNINNVFILYSEDSNAYLYDNDKLYDESGNEINFYNIKSKIVLIFNENSVWYPLMDKDDSNKDNNLKKLLQTYKIEKNIPYLENSEKNFISIIKEKFVLDDDRKKDFAKLFSMDIGYQLYPDIMSYISVKEFPSFNNDIGMVGLIPSFGTDYLRIVASFLSPFADGESQIYKKNGYSAMSQEFFKFNTWGGDIWSSAYIDYTIDTGFRLDIGTCRDMSVYASAILEVSQKKWIRLYGAWIKSEDKDKNEYTFLTHFIVYIPEDKKIMNNGNIENFEDIAKMFPGIDPHIIHLMEIGTNEGYAMFFFQKDYTTEDYNHNWLVRGILPKAKVFEILNELYNDNLFTIDFIEENHTISNSSRKGSLLSYEKGLKLIDENYKELLLKKYLEK